MTNETTPPVALEACPFCGSASVGFKDTGLPDTQVGCNGCGFAAWFPTRATAIAAWNQRATPDTAALREACAKVADAAAAGRRSMMTGRGSFVDGIAGNQADLADRIAIDIRALPLPAPTAVEGAAFASDEQRAREVLAFLKGEGALDGVHFGQPHPTERGAFWWRKHLSALATSPRAAGDRLREAEELLTMLVTYDDEARPNGLMDAIDNDRDPYQSAGMAGLIVHARSWLPGNSAADRLALYRAEQEAAGLPASSTASLRSDDGEAGR